MTLKDQTLPLIHTDKHRLDIMIKLDPLVNQLVRFKLHEIEEMKEGIIRAFDNEGYWIEGGSLAQYLQSTSPGGNVTSNSQFLESKRIHWFQKA